MDELLTVNQVRTLLKVDRLTVYRMLKDGRLHGTKIGHEWRFSRDNVNSLLSGILSVRSVRPDLLERLSPTPSITPVEELPVHCIQLIQQVFSEVAELSPVTLTTDGDPITEVSSPCKFCRLMLSSATGRAACAESWRHVAAQSPGSARFTTCHAGLKYASASVELDGQPVALLAVGQFHTKTPSPADVTAQVRKLSALHGLDHTTLGRAATEVQVLDERKRERMPAWLKSLAMAIAGIEHERSALINRLRSISAISALSRSK
ncbi:MAG: PocR ligand-binding domain-containing protein [Chloroflexota bacterium]